MLSESNRPVQMGSCRVDMRAQDDAVWTVGRQFSQSRVILSAIVEGLRLGCATEGRNGQRTLAKTSLFYCRYLRGFGGSGFGGGVGLGSLNCQVLALTVQKPAHIGSLSSCVMQDAAYESYQVLERKA